MISNVEQYLAELRKELSGCDRATVQDALSDAEEYLRTALGSRPPDTAGAPDAAWTGTAGAEALAQVIESTVSRGNSRRLQAMEQVVLRAAQRWAAGRGSARGGTATGAGIGARGGRQALLPRPVLRRVRRPRRGVTAVSHAGDGDGDHLLHVVVTGLSLSVGLLILIIGLPLAGLFLLSVRGIALIEEGWWKPFSG